MSSQQTATFQEALAILESLPEYQQEDLIHIMQRRRLERRRELLAERIKEARAEYARGDVTRGTVDELIQGVTA
jgi:aminoglycoside phosphotransferase family enzyme